MHYVVVDLEWNQAMSSKSSVFNKLPIHLSGEIIEIGAVKLNDDMTPGEEFTIDVKPVYFRQMHYKVKKKSPALTRSASPPASASPTRCSSSASGAVTVSPS